MNFCRPNLENNNNIGQIKEQNLFVNNVFYEENQKKLKKKVSIQKMKIFIIQFLQVPNLKQKKAILLYINVKNIIQKIKEILIIN